MTPITYEEAAALKTSIIERYAAAYERVNAESMTIDAMRESDYAGVSGVDLLAAGQAELAAMTRAFAVFDSALNDLAAALARCPTEREAEPLLRAYSLVRKAAFGTHFDQADAAVRRIAERVLGAGLAPSPIHDVVLLTPEEEADWEAALATVPARTLAPLRKEPRP